MFELRYQEKQIKIEEGEFKKKQDRRRHSFDTNLIYGFLIALFEVEKQRSQLKKGKR